MPPKARNGFTQHAAPGAAPCSSRTCAIGRRSNAHSATPRLNGFASFRGFLPGALSNACPSGPGRPSRIAREGQASNKARPERTLRHHHRPTAIKPNSAIEHAWHERTATLLNTRRTPLVPFAENQLRSAFSICSQSRSGSQRTVMRSDPQKTEYKRMTSLLHVSATLSAQRSVTEKKSERLTARARIWSDSGGTTYDEQSRFFAHCAPDAQVRFPHISVQNIDSAEF